MGRRFLTAMLLCGAVMTAPGWRAADADPADTAALTVRSSPDAAYAHRIELSGPWIRTIRSAPAARAQTEPVSDVYVTIGDRTYSVDSAYNLYDPAGGTLIMPSASVKRELSSGAVRAAARYYGSRATWEEARQVIGMKAIFTVVDLETGLSFRAQRRAGSTHADVQPVTRQDTAVMKQIYGGRWTWKRRAILVRKDGYSLAASMHGMPHGGDGIPDNGFSGHFCIHFLGSRTHGSGQVDPDHQAMIHKAAGQLKRYVNELSPERMAGLYLSAINQRDPEIAAALFRDRRQAAVYVQRDFADIRAIRQVPGEQAKEEGADDSLAQSVSLYVNTDGNAGARNHVRMTFEFIREGLLEPWKINAVRMK